MILKQSTNESIQINIEKWFKSNILSTYTFRLQTECSYTLPFWYTQPCIVHETAWNIGLLSACFELLKKGDTIVHIYTQIVEESYGCVGLTLNMKISKTMLVSNHRLLSVKNYTETSTSFQFDLLTEWRSKWLSNCWCNIVLI